MNKREKQDYDRCTFQVPQRKELPDFELADTLKNSAPLWWLVMQTSLLWHIGAQAAGKGRFAGAWLNDTKCVFDSP